jgi:hypothetical protein
LQAKNMLFKKVHTDMIQFGGGPWPAAGGCMERWFERRE